MAESTELFFKTAIYYALLIAIVNSPRRLEAYLLNLSLSISLMCCLCLFDFWEIFDFEGIVHLQDLRGHDDEGQALFVSRMRGLGIFQDPNDLSMAIVAAGALCLYQLGNRPTVSRASAVSRGKNRRHKPSVADRSPSTSWR